MKTKLAWLILLLRRRETSGFAVISTTFTRRAPNMIPTKLLYIPKPMHSPVTQLYLNSNPFLHSPLAMSSTTSEASIFLRSFLTLLVSALAGILCDKKRGDGLGTLVTLLVAAHASNLNLSPSQHALYDLCWKTLLPASLALLLLASPSQKDRKSSRQDIRAVAIPFFLASLGSILGCIFSFFVTVSVAVNSVHGRLVRPGRFLLLQSRGLFKQDVYVHPLLVDLSITLVCNTC
jgi:hypothetical protein